MLLGLEGDQLLDVVILQRRQFDKTGEDRLAGDRVAGLGFADLEALRQIRDGDRVWAIREESIEGSATMDSES
jgi:hypothetical protein